MNSTPPPYPAPFLRDRGVPTAAEIPMRILPRRRRRRSERGAEVDVEEPDDPVGARALRPHDVLARDHRVQLDVAPEGPVGPALYRLYRRYLYAEFTSVKYSPFG